MSALSGDARRVKKDVLADIVSLKHECQNFIMTASMRKAVLHQSENDVKADMQVIVAKLQQLLKVIHDNARFTTTQEVKGETDKINDEIIFLEEQYKSLDETEEYVKTNTSNANLKPLKVGKEKCEYTRERLDAYKSGITRKCAKFVLHPLLAQILEQMETFSLGHTLVLPVPEENNVIPEEDEEEFDDSQSNDQRGSPSMKREQSNDPLRTSFMRSDSSKLIKLPNKKVTSVLSSRQNSEVETKNNTQGTGSGRSSVVEKNSMSNSVTDTKVPTAPPKQSKLITRSKTKVVTIKEESERGNEDVEEEYKAVVGLKATLTGRSTSAPFINLSSQQNSAFVVKKVEYKSRLGVSYKEVMETKKHANSCYITSITALANGNVVLCDTVHDSLQLYNPETKSISEMNCPHPWGVAAVSDTAVAVSLHYDHKIILVQAAQSLERLQEKDIVLKCNASLVYDVKFYAYRIYVLCIDSDIHILDLKGREYGRIKTGMPINTLRYFDVNIDKELIVVSGEKGVACANFKGLPLWNFQPKNKGKLISTGVLIHKGFIVVADWENSNLTELYDEGEGQTSIFSTNLERPMAICMSLSGKEMFVSQGDYDFIEQKARMVKVLNIVIEEDT